VVSNLAPDPFCIRLIWRGKKYRVGVTLRTAYDVILRGGFVVDGTGNPWFKSDVAVKDGKIAKVGNLGSNISEITVEVDRMAVSPGFIDMHSHSDFMLWVSPASNEKIRQGVTTELIGNCGSSAAPLMGVAEEDAKRSVNELLGGSSEKMPIWSTLSGYFDQLERQGIAVNVATLVGHSTVRKCVLGYENRDPTESELNQMKRLVVQGMMDGAFGISTGLIYPPGCYAETSELIELCRVAGGHGGIYATHIRNESDALLEAVKEAIEIGKKAGLPVHISHHKAAGRLNWGKVNETLKMIEEARGAGLDVTFDVYPYTAGCSWSLSHMLPQWIYEGGVEKLVERLKNPEIRERIKKEISESRTVSPLIKHGEWQSILVASVKSQENKQFEGRSISEISRSKRVDPLDCLLDLIVQEEDEITGIFFLMGQDDVRNVISHRVSMIGSDSVPRRKSGFVHPRNYGTFPRVIRRYVNEMGSITFEDAVRKMTSFPAQRLGIGDRGLIREDTWADIVVFDPQSIADRATYEDPFQFPTGIEYVLVNGVMTVEKGKYTGALAGKVLRKCIGTSETT